MASREKAIQLDAQDELAGLRARFIAPEPGMIYLDSSSLGRPLKSTRKLLEDVLEGQWALGREHSWPRWIDLALRIGDRLGAGLLGAAPGQTVLCDSTTVNLYKLASAGLAAKPGRKIIITDDDNFATDRYVAQGIAAQSSAELRLLRVDPDRGLEFDELKAALECDVAVVALSLVAYRSGRLLDMAKVNDLVHEVGGYMLWDLSHAAGAVPIELDETGADMAVGCSCKYLGGGPGAPAYLYVRKELQESLTQPIWGWFGQRRQFNMERDYDPVPGISRFQCGCPPIISLAGTQPGIDLLLEAGINAVRRKSVQLTTFIADFAEAWLPEFRLASPLGADQRGAHITLAHPQAQKIVARLEDLQVAADYLNPNRIRFGPSALYNSFVEIWEALERLRQLHDEFQ